MLILLTKECIVHRIYELRLDVNKYWILTGAAMVMHGIRDTAQDIDLGCTTSLIEAFIADGYEMCALDDGSRKIKLASDIEVFEEWGYGTIINIDGLPVVSLKDIIRIKQKLGRPKDLHDIELIQQYMDRQPK